MSDALNTAKKYVVTQRPESLEWGPFEGLASDLVEDVSRIKSQDGGDPILFGSSMLTSPLLEPGVSDEVVLLVDPVLLGTGKRIFAEFLCDHQFVWNLARKSLCRRTVEWYERKLKTIGSP
jgi:dihydrofolate reductase